MRVLSETISTVYASQATLQESAQSRMGAEASWSGQNEVKKPIENDSVSNPTRCKVLELKYSNWYSSICNFHFWGRRKGGCMSTRVCGHDDGKYFFFQIILVVNDRSLDRVKDYPFNLHWTLFVFVGEIAFESCCCSSSFSTFHFCTEAILSNDDFVVFSFFDRSSATSTMPLLLYLLLKKAFLLISTLNQVFLGFCDVRGWTVSLSLFSMCCVCESFTISPFLLRKSSFQIPIYSISNFISFELHSISNFNSIPTGSSIPSSNLQSGSGQKSQCDLKGHWVSNVSLLFGSRIFYQSPYVLWHQLFVFWSL